MIIKYIYPLIDGEFSFSRLWADFPHPLPIAGLMMSAAYYFDDLNFRYFPYILFPFVVLKYVGICTAFYLSYKHEKTKIDLKVLLVFTMFALVVFNLNTGLQYYWWLVYVQYVYHFLAIIYLIAILQYLKYGNPMSLIWVVIQGAILLLTARVFGLPWMLSVGIALLIRALFIRDQISLRCGFIIISIVLTLVLDKLFYALMDIQLHKENLFNIHGLYEYFSIWWAKKIEFFNYIIASITTGLISFEWALYDKKWEKETLLYVVYLVFSLYLFALVITLRNIKYLAFLIPLIIFIFLFIMLFAAMFLRVDPNVTWVSGYFLRYISYRDLGIIATIWVLFMSSRNQISGNFVRFFSIAGLVVLFMAIPYLAKSYSDYRWEQVSELHDTQHNQIQQLTFGHHWATDPEFRTPNANVCDAFIETSGVGFSPEFPCDINKGVWKWDVLRMIGKNKLTSLFSDKLTKNGEQY